MIDWCLTPTFVFTSSSFRTPYHRGMKDEVSCRTLKLAKPEDHKVSSAAPGALVAYRNDTKREKSNKKKRKERGLPETTSAQQREEVASNDITLTSDSFKKKKKKDKQNGADAVLLSGKETLPARTEDTDSQRKKKRKREFQGEDVDKNDALKQSKEKKLKTDTIESGDMTPASAKRNSQMPTATPLEVKKFLETHSITINTPPDTLPAVPVLSFTQLNIPKQLLTCFAKFEEPTPIQSCTWPPALQGLDVIGIAETGSGKTLAFAIPALVHLINLPHPGKKDRTTVSVLVLSPTRELAMQTNDMLSQLGAPFGIASVAVFGGVPKEPQIQMLRNSSKAKNSLTTRIIVGTPGRILDLMQEDVCDLSGVEYLVLDEADRMLDKGFENDIREIISKTKPSAQRQTMMFSATWPEAVRRLASTFQKSPVRVTVGSEELSANGRVEQCVEVFDESREKDFRLLSVLRSQGHEKGCTTNDVSLVLVFALYKKEASRVEGMLRRQGYAVGALHGDMTQKARTETLEKFKKGTIGIMVATDVAARGLDIPNVGTVINYTFPLTIEDYVHRIGRTGRGGRNGRSITFFTGDNHERSLAGELARVLREGGFNYDALKKFPMTIKKKEHSVYGAFYRDDIPVPKRPTKIVFQ